MHWSKPSKLDRRPGFEVVIFKSITQPSMKEFDTLIAEARRQAKEAGLKRSDVYGAIAKSRGRK
jgi:hypothetical protein